MLDSGFSWLWNDNQTHIVHAVGSMQTYTALSLRNKRVRWYLSRLVRKNPLFRRGVLVLLLSLKESLSQVIAECWVRARRRCWIHWGYDEGWVLRRE